MVYYYIHPFKPQYFFPVHSWDDPVFQSFFQPYSVKGKMSWYLFCNSRLYRRFFKKEDIEEYIPEERIRSILDAQCALTFNKGTPGPEQKVTALGKDERGYFFIKYAQTPLARNYVNNEYNILKQLEYKVDFAPKPTSFYKDKQQILLRTEVLQGNREGGIALNETILKVLIRLPQMDIEVQKSPDSDVKKAFAHGDFCPWNMMDNNGKKVLFDWEMGGSYPLGYDLFTFIFQTNFLLTPKKSIKEVIVINEEYIDRYFSHFGIQEWHLFLAEFASVKTRLEKSKEAEGLFKKYKKLSRYV